MNKVNEKFLDAALKAALDESIQQEMAALPSDEELNEMFPPSADFDKRIMKIIGKEKRPSRRKIFTRMAASVAVLLVGAVSAWAFFVDREPAAAYEEVFPVPEVVWFDADIVREYGEYAFDDGDWFRTIYIAGHEVTIFESMWEGGFHTITWYEGDNVFQIFSNAEIDELIKMVEKILLPF